MQKLFAAIYCTLALFLTALHAIYAQPSDTATSSAHSTPINTITTPPQTALALNQSLYLPIVAKPRSPNDLNPFEQDVLTLVNSERAKVGCGALTANDKLVAAARGHSQDMAANDFFSHTGSNGSSPGDRIEAQGYNWSTWGENIAAGYTTPADVMGGWMDSPGHRDNILNCSFTEIGIGYVYNANDAGAVDYRHYWTQVFGRPG
ncbi:MAG: CAP domain-containing protein [Anaerolineales bacterium]|nr:CAP domain-containing protein [Anaerolineales bacterium]